VETLRAVADEVFALVTEFGGNNSSEHGDGLVRSEFNASIFREELTARCVQSNSCSTHAAGSIPERRSTRRG
jgi:hypothetical protein